MTNGKPPALDPRTELERVLKRLATRREQSVAALSFIGDALAELGLSEPARVQYELVLERIGQDSSVSPSNRSLRTRVRARLLALLRAEGKYQEALEQVDRLIHDNPKALEPRLERGYILQGWAQREPEHFAAAISQWTELRLALSRMRNRPPEYFDVVYRAADCLVAQGKHENDKEKTHQAEQLLKSTLAVSPDLSGAEMVAKYQELLKKIGEPSPKGKARPSKPRATAIISGSDKR